LGFTAAPLRFNITHMKVTRLLAVIIAAVFFTGCIVQSLNPLFDEKDLVSYSDIAGSWTQEGEGKGIWKFEPDGKRYKLTHTDDEKHTATLIASIGRIGTNIFMDTWLEDDDGGKSLNQFGAVHLVQVHSFMKVTKDGDTLRLTMMDLDWLDKTLKENPKLLPHVMRKNGPILTASTEELQKFVAKHAADKAVFKNDVELKPKK
jgi:hypothetical protein